MDLQKIREEIDKIDDSILRLLVQRFKLGNKVALYKAKRGLPIRDRQRERHLYEDRAKKLERLGYPDRKFTKRFFKLIIKKLIKIEKAYIKDYFKNHETKNNSNSWWKR